MEKDNGIRSGKLTKKGVSSLKTNIFVFAFFLLLSFIFWYLNSLGKAIQSDIRYPIRFINIPKYMKMSEDTPTKLNLVLQGTGFSMLKLKISGNRIPAQIDLTKVPYKSTWYDQSADYYIVTADLVHNFNLQLNPECRIISVKPDTLFFSFTKEEED